MGIEADRFVVGVPQDAFCFLCYAVLDDPVEVIECGHFFCNQCLQDWQEKSTENEESVTCPYCGILIEAISTRKSKPLWSLIQNMNVYCVYKHDGCDITYKYGYQDDHQKKCLYEKKRTENNNSEELVIEKCPTCRSVLDEDINTHDCMRELLKLMKTHANLITNLEHENDRLRYKLSTCEKQFFDERTELEGQFYLESLRHNKEIRDLRTRLAHIHGEIGVKSSSVEHEEITINLKRLNGTLGFNIIGGSSKSGDSSGGIFVSRIAEGGAADQPDKLRLHDRILEVDGVDLQDATHEAAVNAFRTSGNSVKMVVRRKICKTRTSEVSTQTHLAYEANDDGFVNSPTKRTGWFDLMGISLSTDFSSSEVKTDYDSAYDTLNKSSRHSQQSPSMADQSDLDSTNTETTLAAAGDSSFKANVSADDEGLEKRQSTFFVLPSKDDFSLSEHANDPDAEFECEYEEVVLHKRGGKFGVLLCYGGNEADVSVYVGDVEENSDADVSGKIMVGDQIVQINGCQVIDVEQAYKMFEKNDVITLVVARAVYDNNTDFYDEAEETDLDMLDCIAEEESEFQSKTSSPIYDSSVSSKSSGQSSPSNVTSPTKSRSSKPLSPTHQKAHELDTQCDSENRKQERSEKESKTKHSLKSFVKNKLSGHQKDKRTGSHSDDSLDFNKLPRCDSNSSTNSNKTSSKSSKENVNNTRNNDELLRARLKEQRQQSKMKAYMDSPSLNRHKVNPQVSLFQAPYMINGPTQIPYTYHGIGSMTPVFVSRPPKLTPTPPHGSLGSRNNMTASVSSLRSALKNSQMNNNVGKRNETHKRVSIDPHPGWNDTEKRVWEEFKIIQSMERGNGENKQEGDASMIANIEAEWRVRRSKDGKHIYIKKTNSARTKIMKERAQQINDERCGITTDDDAFTVYKGQYWSRDQRKKQLSRHNERRKRLVQKTELKALYENKTEKEMAEMVQRKMTLPVFDNFITIEEILSQRNRSGVFAGPIHVTTI